LSARAERALRKFFAALLEATDLEANTDAKPPRARVGARYGAHPQHIALALCEGREAPQLGYIKR
jgi:hypothetical protein